VVLFFDPSLFNLVFSILHILFSSTVILTSSMFSIWSWFYSDFLFSTVLFFSIVPLLNSWTSYDLLYYSTCTASPLLQLFYADLYCWSLTLVTSCIPQLLYHTTLLGLPLLVPYSYYYLYATTSLPHYSTQTSTLGPLLVLLHVLNYFFTFTSLRQTPLSVPYSFFSSSAPLLYYSST
jgi:hypothetical protein